MTIKESSESLFKDKGSKFFAFAYPVDSTEEIKEHIAKLKKEHYSARHHCYAWMLGADQKSFRANDDGEPSSTAGKPILGQIQKANLTNILIVVVRYFGGTLLGTSGLINAYREAAALAIDAAEIEERLVLTKFYVDFDYLAMNNVMKVFKSNNLRQIETNFDLRCEIKSEVRQKNEEAVFAQLKDIEGVKIRIIE